MLILEKIDPSEGSARIIVLFGAGLIGSAICKDIVQEGGYIKSLLPFDWNSAKKQGNDIRAVDALLSRNLKNFLSAGYDSVSLAFVWSAGRAGFTATEQCMDSELATFANVLNLVREIMEKFPAIHIFFHHFSSAGGLFEGQKLVDYQAVPAPKRFYGILKLRQELLLSQLDSRLRKAIYRPTSVYGFADTVNRMGLIPTLIRNGIHNRVSVIYGNLSTLRDYIFNNDIASFVYNSLFLIPAAQSTATYFLGSGKPSSIYEIRHCIEKMIGRKIYLEFRGTHEIENASDITVNSSVLPHGLNSTELKTGMRIIKESMLR